MWPQNGLDGPKRDKSGTCFSDQISMSPNILKYDLKLPQFVQFWANLTHFVPKSGDSDLRNKTPVKQVSLNAALSGV